MSAWESFWRSVRRSRGSLILMSQSEWEEAVERALAKLGITYEQLADMARRGDFTSIEARKLWVSIGGTPDARIAELEANLEAVRGHRDALVEMTEGVRAALVASQLFPGGLPSGVAEGVEHLAREFRHSVQGRIKETLQSSQQRDEIARLTAALDALQARVPRSESADLEQMRAANTQLSDRLAAVHREKDDLERQLAEREGRATKPTVITGEGLSTWTPR